MTAESGPETAPAVDLADAQDRVIYPDTDTTRVTFGDAGEQKSMVLRPLVLKHSKIVGRKCEAAFKRLQVEVAKDATATELAETADALVEVVLYLGQLHGVDGLTADWIEENLSAHTVHAVVEKQLAVQGHNDFLLSAVATICAVASLANANADKLKGALAELLRQVKPVSSAVSATPGIARSTSSPAVTPAAS